MPQWRGSARDLASAPPCRAGSPRPVMTATGTPCGKRHGVFPRHCPARCSIQSISTMILWTFPFTGTANGRRGTFRRSMRASRGFLASPGRGGNCSGCPRRRKRRCGRCLGKPILSAVCGFWNVCWAVRCGWTENFWVTLNCRTRRIWKRILRRRPLKRRSKTSQS